MSNIYLSISEKLATLNMDIFHYENIVRCYVLAKLNIEHSRKLDYADGIHTAEFASEASRYQLLPFDESPYYDGNEVKKMIEHQKQEFSWEFLFIGANIDAVETAAQIGISRDRAVKYCANSKGTQTLYETLSAPISATRSGEDVDEMFCIFKNSNSVE